MILIDHLLRNLDIALIKVRSECLEPDPVTRFVDVGEVGGEHAEMSLRAKCRCEVAVCDPVEGAIT